jgi:hypothetical protein
MANQASKRYQVVMVGLPWQEVRRNTINRWKALVHVTTLPTAVNLCTFFLGSASRAVQTTTLNGPCSNHLRFDENIHNLLLLQSSQQIPNLLRSQSGRRRLTIQLPLLVFSSKRSHDLMRRSLTLFALSVGVRISSSLRHFVSARTSILSSSLEL